MPDSYRRTITIKGRKIFSPRFDRKKDADDWYRQMKRKGQFLRHGFAYVDDSKLENVMSYSKRFLERRIKNYDAPTWQSDEQRLRDYILPKIAELAMSQVTTAQIKLLLQDITDNGKSIGTRTRVRALLSTMFNSALNEDPPVVKFNPVSGIKFDERRIGKKQPSMLVDADACISFLKSAKELGPMHLLIASIGLMTGLRKSEMLALDWGSIDFKLGRIHVNKRLVQATMELKSGTKRGENTSRWVGVPKELLRILRDIRTQVKFKKDSDFIFARHDGRFLNPREMWRINQETAQKAEVEVTVHGLRHTYGREFAARGGNLKALQAMLGHSSSSTTDLYSELSGKRAEGFGEIVSFEIEKE